MLRRVLSSGLLSWMLAVSVAFSGPDKGSIALADHGARLDGRTLDRQALQVAIDEAHRTGGGTIVVPAGRTLLTGSFELKSHVTLHLEPGSRLVASTRQEDYRAGVLIEAFDAEALAITGTGTIDGRGIAFMESELPHIFRPKAWRPKLMVLEGCRRIRLNDFTIRDSPSWAVHLAGCDDVVVHGLSILNNPKIPNCDGIDPDHSRNVRISDCHIEAGDDCIVIKNRREYARYGVAENITVTNCTLVSRSAALKIGTETVNDIRNVVFSNCVIRGSNRGIALMLRDEGNIEQVLIQNIAIETRRFHSDWWGAAEPISITTIPRQAGGAIGQIRGVRVQQVISRSEGGVLIHGSPSSVIEDVVLENISVELTRSTTEKPGRLDLRPSADPDTHLRPLAGFKVAHARDITVRNCSVTWKFAKPDTAVGLNQEQSGEAVRVENFREKQAR